MRANPLGSAIQVFIISLHLANLLVENFKMLYSLKNKIANVSWGFNIQTYFEPSNDLITIVILIHSPLTTIAIITDSHSISGNQKHQFMLHVQI